MAFWFDNWVPNVGPLVQVATGPWPSNAVDLKVSDYVTVAGLCDWHGFQHLIPTEVCVQMAAVPSPGLYGGEGKIFWGLSKDGEFTTSSAYMLVSNQATEHRYSLWNVICRWDDPQRVRAFLWLAAQEKLLTNSQIVHRSMCVSDMCEVCGLGCETSLHVLRDYPNARMLWDGLGASNIITNFYHLETREWLLRNQSAVSFQKDNKDWPTIAGVGAWLLWQWRNKIVFDEGFE